MVLLWFRKNIISTFVEIIFWLPFTDTFLTNVPSYGSSKMTRMRVLLDDAKEENLVALDMANIDNSNVQGWNKGL